MATSMGAKHKSGRQLTVEDFLPEAPRRASGNWQDWLDATREYMGAFEKAGKAIN